MPSIELAAWGTAGTELSLVFKDKLSRRKQFVSKSHNKLEAGAPGLQSLISSLELDGFQNPKFRILGGFKRFSGGGCCHLLPSNIRILL